MPTPAVRGLASLTWRARAQALDPGWLDLLEQLPVMSTERARSEIDWRPTRSAEAVVNDLLAGIAANAGTASAALRPRDDARSAISTILRYGPIGWRRET